MIRWTWHRPEASGKRTGWAKVATGFEPSNGPGAKAFIGSYLDDGVLREDPEGTIVVQVSPVGSVKNGHYAGQFFRVGSEGLEAISGEFDWHKEWFAVKDAATALFAATAAPEPAWVTMQCEKCGRRMQLEACDLPLLDDGIACPFHPGSTYWLRRVRQGGAL